MGITEEESRIIVDADYIVANKEEIKKKIENEFRAYVPTIFNVGEDFINQFLVEFNIEKFTKQVILDGLDEISADLVGFKLIEKVENKIVWEIERKDVALSKDLGQIVLFFCIVNLFWNVNLRPAFMLPAERSGLNMFYRELNINRNDAFYGFMNKNNTSELERRIAKYPLPISQYINLLNSIDEKEKSEYTELVATLEEKIICSNFNIKTMALFSFEHQTRRKLISIFRHQLQRAYLD